MFRDTPTLIYKVYLIERLLKRGMSLVVVVLVVVVVEVVVKEFVVAIIEPR